MSAPFMTDGLEVDRPRKLLPSGTEIFRRDKIDEAESLEPGTYLVTEAGRPTLVLRVKRTARVRRIVRWMDRLCTPRLVED